MEIGVGSTQDRPRRGTRGSPGWSNETDSRVVTARLTRRGRTSYLQSTTSSQAQIKCSLYPPCFPTTTISIVTNTITTTPRRRRHRGLHTFSICYGSRITYYIVRVRPFLQQALFSPSRSPDPSDLRLNGVNEVGWRVPKMRRAASCRCNFLDFFPVSDPFYVASENSYLINLICLFDKFVV